MIKHLFLLLTLLMAASCERPDYLGKETKDQVLVLNMYSEPPTLDPAKAADAPSSGVLSMLFDGLTRVGFSDTPEMAAAESVEISEDRKTYTFHLRDSLWSDGTPVTAHDFSYAWQRALSPHFPADLVYQMYVIKNAQLAKEGKVPLSDVGIWAKDKKTFVVTLELPTPYFLEMLSLPCFLPVPQHIAAAHDDWAYEAGPLYVSNGPFTLERWVHHSEIKVSRNKSYWDRDHVHLNAIVMLMVEDVNTELHLFEDGAIDWAGKPISMGLPTDALSTLKSSGRLEEAAMAATYFFAFNTTKAPFNNLKFRKALSYAIHRQEIIDNIVQGGESLATGLVPPSMTIPIQHFSDNDVKKAQKLFKEALEELGTTEEALAPITLIYNTGEAHHKIAQAIQQQWSDSLGVRVELRNLEWKVYIDKVQQKDYDIARMSWIAAFNDPITFLELLQRADDTINITGWSHPKYTALLDRSAQTTPAEKRAQLLAEAEALLMEHMPMIPLYHLTNSYLRNPKLKGFYMSPTGFVDFKQAYFATEPSQE